MCSLPKLYEKGDKFSGAWNFGPDVKEAKHVEWLVKTLCRKYGRGASYTIDKRKHTHETTFLALNCSKAKKELQWRPKMNLDTALDNIVEWTRAFENKTDLRKLCIDQIKEFTET